METNVFDIVTYFIIYSFLGWIMESVFRSFCEKKIINSGFLKGPFCPIYGFGAIMMYLLLDQFQNSWILLCILSIILLTLWEYVVGILLEKIFHTKYWDYSDKKIHFQGRICLENSIYWGILGILFIKYIHPFLQNTLAMIDNQILYFVIFGVGLIFIIDVVTTIISVKNIDATLKKVESLNVEIKEKLKELSMAKKEKELEKATRAESIQTMLEQLKKKRNRTILRLYRNVYRLKKAFPAIDTNEVKQVLSKKIENTLKRNKKIIKNKYNSEKDLKKK